MNKYIVLDIETTGFSPETHKITEIGALRVEDHQVVGSFKQLIDPEMEISQEITKLTGISNLTIQGMPTISEVMPRFIEFCGDLPILGHNIMFDYSFLKTAAVQLKLTFEKRGADTLTMARCVLPKLESRSLTYLCNYFSIVRENEHRAFDDANATNCLFEILKSKYLNQENSSIFEPKPLFYKPQKMESITEKQEKYLLNLAKLHGVTLIKPIAEYSKSEASREIDKIINQYGKSL